MNVFWIQNVKQFSHLHLRNKTQQKILDDLQALRQKLSQVCTFWVLQVRKISHKNMKTFWFWKYTQIEIYASSPLAVNYSRIGFLCSSPLFTNWNEIKFLWLAHVIQYKFRIYYIHICFVIRSVQPSPVTVAINPNLFNLYAALIGKNEYIGVASLGERRLHWRKASYLLHHKNIPTLIWFSIHIRI